MKTFFRLLAVSVAISFFVYPLDLYDDSLNINLLPLHFQWLRRLSNSKECYHALLQLATSHYLIVILGIPFYELAIYPLASNWIPSALKRAGIGAFGTILFASVASSVGMVGHAHTNATVECLFVVNRTASSVVDIDYLWIGIPLGVVSGIELATLVAALFEFLCAQTPYTMKELIIGLALSAVALSHVLSGVTVTTWAHAWSPPVTYPTCAFWFYLFIIVVTVHGWSSVVWDCCQVVQEEGEE